VFARPEPALRLVVSSVNFLLVGFRISASRNAKRSVRSRALLRLDEELQIRLRMGIAADLR